jgi:hypothetical protein
LFSSEYGIFKVGDEQSIYQATIGDYNGGSSNFDALSPINGFKFAAPGQPADAAIADAQQCATEYQAGWWFDNCGACVTCTSNVVADKTTGTTAPALTSFQACLAPKIG